MVKDSDNFDIDLEKSLEFECPKNFCKFYFQHNSQEICNLNKRLGIVEVSEEQSNMKVTTLDVTLQFIRTQLLSIETTLNAKLDRLNDSILADSKRNSERVYSVIGTVVSGVILAIALNFVMSRVETDTKPKKVSNLGGDAIFVSKGKTPYTFSGVLK